MEEELLKWAASMGVTDAPLNVVSPELGRTLGIANFPDEGGRGVVARRDIEQGELILRVPHAALLGVHCARNDPNFSKLLEDFDSLSSLQILVAYVLREVASGHASAWYTYFQCLPRLHHTLAHFSGAEAQELQVEDAISTAMTSREKSKALWKEALPLLLKLGMKQRYTTFKAWLWATATVGSRSLYVAWDKAGVLCPIGDLFNYEPPGSPGTGHVLNNLLPLLPAGLGCDELREKVDAFLSKTMAEQLMDGDEESRDIVLSSMRRLRDGGYEPSVASYCFYARTKYKSGQQVLLCYGQYTNLELLEHYGFMLPDNPNDAVYLPLPQPRDFGLEDGVLEARRQQHGGHHIQATGTPCFSLLEELRLRASPASVRKSLGYLASQGMPISKESDDRVYRWLCWKCRVILEALPTTAAEDIVTLIRLEEGKQSKTCSCASCLSRKNFSDVRLERLRTCLRWRLGYKLILQKCLQLCAQKLG